MRNIPYELKQAIHYLSQMGHRIDIKAYKPGRYILYRLVKINDDFSEIQITPYFTRKEMIIWAKGFIAYPTISDGNMPLI